MHFIGQILKVCLNGLGPAGAGMVLNIRDRDGNVHEPLVTEELKLSERTSRDEAMSQESSSQREEVILGWRVGGAHTRVALDLNATDDIHGIDQHDRADAGDERDSLSAELPFVVWLGQWATPVIALRVPF
jgi:hypothetical protein